MKQAKIKRALGVLMLALLAASSLHAAELWRLDAPQVLKDQLLPWLPPMSSGDVVDAEEADIAKLGLVRRLRERIPALLSTEGYFSPDIKIDAAVDPVVVTLVPGSRARVVAVNLSFLGSLGEPAEVSRVEELRNAWNMPIGNSFRQQDWSLAKTALLIAVTNRDFPAAKIVESVADVDPASAEVHLSVVVDSGPVFYFGPLEVTGLSQYKPELLERYKRFEQGQPYSQNRLLQFQSALQATPYFSAVEVTMDTDPAHASAAPVHVVVTEAKPRRAGAGVGFSTNTGARTDFSYRDANLFGNAWQLSSGVRLESVRQTAFADVFLPPTPDDHRYSVGGVVERSDIEHLAITRQAIGVARSRERGRFETRIGLSFQHEARQAEGSERNVNQALALTGGWIYRRVDSMLDPRSGYVLNLQLGGASQWVLSDANFVRTYGRLVTYFPITARDVLSARIEAGRTAAASRTGVPEDFLFRTGGAQTVRGYSYLSLGESEGNAVVGGRYMAAGSIEHTHWFGDKWGMATFIDAGNATDHIDTWRAKVGVGVGARWRSPAGPLAADLAWGVDSRHLHLHIAIAVAF
ncbi:MAG: outer membrane protein [Rhodocyclales bacterium]|nr:outer membrane protein [Rhodocyclales bacterium]